MFRFHIKYFLLASVLFVIEVLIALFVRDAFVRPYVGDYLVVMLIYCAVQTVLNALVINVAVGVLLFAYAIEVLQYFHIVNKLGLQNNIIAKTVIGYGFEWLDLLAYTLGIITTLALERIAFNNRKKGNTRSNI
jgi:predicted outer membrane lipoprotein